MSRVSVSTWALHSALGKTFPGRPGAPDAYFIEPVRVRENEAIPLLDVPARLVDMGIHTMELCHFHLPSREPDYIAEFRAALETAQVELWSLLVDDGDITHPEHGARDTEWIAEWVETAAALGAKRARVIAGKEPYSYAAIQRSRTILSDLAARAAERGVRLMTENWFALLSSPEAVLELLRETHGHLGLCFDFGNWDGPDKYADLAAIAALAESSHAKCSYNAPGEPDRTDFRRCLDLLKEVDFDGPLTLVYGEPSDVWGSLAVQREFILRAGYALP